MKLYTSCCTPYPIGVPSINKLFKWLKLHLLPVIQIRYSDSLYDFVHLGIESCIHRARDIVHWPGMNASLKAYIHIQDCSLCVMYQVSSLVY